MICPHCHLGYMLQHPEHSMSQLKWLKCTTCKYCCKEDELVLYYKEDQATRIIPRKHIIEAETERAKGIESARDTILKKNS